jgi:hypothetical protein
MAKGKKNPVPPVGIKRQSTANPAGFFNHPLPQDEVDKVISVRNNTDHINLNNVDRNWQTEVPAYVLLCNSINETGVTAEIQSIIDRMVAGILDGLVEFSFQFTSGFTYEKAFGLSQIVYGVLLAFLGIRVFYPIAICSRPATGLQQPNGVPRQPGKVACCQSSQN